jgi:hypothetical protein
MVSLYQAIKSVIAARTARIATRPSKIKTVPIRFAPLKPTPRRSLYERLKEIVGARLKPKPPVAPAAVTPKPVAPPKPAARAALVDRSLLDDFLHLGKTIHTTTSSNVQAMQYDEDHKLLTIWFNGGGLKNRRYVYAAVQPSMAERFYLAASKGSWVWSEIRRPNYPFLDKTVSRPPS